MVGGTEELIANRFRYHIQQELTLAAKIIARNTKIRHAVINGDWDKVGEEIERMIKQASKILDEEEEDNGDQERAE